MQGGKRWGASFLAAAALLAGVALGFCFGAATSATPEQSKAERENAAKRPLADAGESASVKALRAQVADLKRRLAAAQAKAAATNEVAVTASNDGRGQPRGDPHEWMENLKKNDPERYGVAEFDKAGNCLSIEEKPEHPKSNYAVPGIYFYDNKVVKYAKEIEPSARGEYEISSINSLYLENGELDVVLLGRGMAWLDTGTPDGLLKAAEFVQTIQSMQGLYVSCIEEIAWRKGYITSEQLEKLGKELEKTDYGQYLLNLAKNNKK